MIKLADQKIREARSRIAAPDRELAALQRLLPGLSSRVLAREAREEAIRLGDKRSQAFRELSSCWPEMLLCRYIFEV